MLGTRIGSKMRARTLLLAAAVLATPVAVLVPGQPAGAVSQTKIGAHSGSWAAFDAAVGPVQIYRDFDQGFSYARWQDTAAYRAHPNAPANDYSFHVLPQRLTDPADPINAKIRSFLATTPKNLIITNFHEPDYDIKYFHNFTPAQFRAGILALARMVRQQNAVDGGTRRTSVILMDVSFNGYWPWPASDWWPTDARDGGHVDLIAGDIYALPHATNTACCPAGYTDGLKWQKPSYMLSFLRTFAVNNATPWAVAELGYLEDIHDPLRKSQALSDAVAYAKANGATHISYFDARGPRADWRLRYSTPVGTISSSSNAYQRWRSLVAANA
jgi:hypothetical protein